jgi:predicted TPR repeat methyltransferase
MAASTSRFDRWASSYEDNTLQQYLYVPVHQTALRLALQLLPHPRRVLDVSCGTGRLLRQARRCYPTAELAGVDLASQMVAAASAVTPARLAVGMEVIGRAHTPWFQLPDVQVIAAMKATPRSGPGRKAARDVRFPGPRAT